ncbi:MAG: hypothetical protein D6806_02430 [Deltaproteobacteria bacterium]|nr:MAG: hypothetical protein D6806_02430 [Deltaproteobacteria bacterium]
MKLAGSVLGLLLPGLLMAACGGGDESNLSPDEFCRKAVTVGCEKQEECGSLLEGQTVQQCIDSNLAILNNCEGATWNCPEAKDGAAACLDAIRAQSCEDFNQQVPLDECALCPNT